MWEPRIDVPSSAVFTAAYLVITIVVAALIVWFSLRRGDTFPRARWGIAGYFAIAVGSFLWLMGSPPGPAALFGAGIVPAVLIASGVAAPRREPGDGENHL